MGDSIYTLTPALANITPLPTLRQRLVGGKYQMDWQSDPYVLTINVHANDELLPATRAIPGLAFEKLTFHTNGVIASAGYEYSPTLRVGANIDSDGLIDISQNKYIDIVPLFKPQDNIASDGWIPLTPFTKNVEHLRQGAPNFTCYCNQWGKMVLPAFIQLMYNVANFINRSEVLTTTVYGWYKKHRN